MLTVVIVAALAAVTSADSARDTYPEVITKSRISQQCAGYCKDSNKFILQPDSTYVYSYEGTTTSGVPGSSNDTSVVKVTAKAHVQVTASPCELILQIHESRLQDSGAEGLQSVKRQREFSKVLEAHPLRFSYQDGRIEQLCPAADEAVWALNIKRGLLSAFQNSMVDLNKDAHLYERDVSGSCETTYHVKPSMWSEVQIVKHKNLHSCSGRDHQSLGLPGIFSPLGKSVPIIKSDQVCLQTINLDDGQYLSSSTCQETHIFAPFSNFQSGIRTTAVLSLSLDNIVPSVEPTVTDLFINKRTNLLFELTTSGETAVTEAMVWETLESLVDQSQQGVGGQVPQLFDQLIRQLSNLQDQELVKLFDEQREKRARKYLLDALPLVGSAGSLQAMYQIYSAREVSHDELDSWLTVLAFHKKPTLEMLQTLDLFMQDGYHPRTWLAVSAVVHSYCRHDSECADTPEVQAIMSRLESTLGQSCLSSTREQQEAVVVALKAVGNAGFIRSLDVLKNCFMNEHNAMEVRLAAIAATRRFPCNKLQKLAMLSVFQDRSQDTELRIAAYLAVVQCPDTAIISRLRDVLYQEDANQVLSFVWTHLTNLQESTSSWKREIRQMLQDNYLVNKFKTDARKFSRNYEMSTYSDILNTGATVDSNIVFSTKSYLPRSATLNLTLDLFGEAVNIFEIGTRLEGFESLVEDLFSPKGYFPDEGMQKMLKNMRKEDDSKNEVIQTFSEQFAKGTVNEPKGQMFARVFGNELYLTQLNNLNEFLNFKPSSKYSFKYFMDSLSSLFKNNNVDVTKSFRFINTEYVIPTIVGLPLKLEVNGTATVGIQMNTQVDLNGLLKTKSGKVALSINPSAAVQIDGKMMVDVVFTQAGVQTKGSLSSNTYLDTNLAVEGGQIIDVFVNVPRDKVEILNVSSAIYVKQRDQLVEIEGVGEVSEHDSCSGDRVPTLSGMRMCSQYTIRNASDIENSPYFPLTGRFQYALALQKSDSFDLYELHLKQFFDLSSEGFAGMFSFQVDTPGSKMKRRLSTMLSYTSKSGAANFDLESPVGKVYVHAKLGITPVEKSLDLWAQVNSRDYATLRLGLQTENSVGTIKYEPSLFVQADPNLFVNISGRLNIIPGHKYSADFNAVGLTNEPITVSADVSSAKGRVSVALTAKAENVDVKVNTRIINSPTSTSCKALARYALGNRPVQSVDFMARLQHHKKGGFSKRQLLVNLQMSELLQYSTRLGWILYRTDQYCDSNIELKVGKTQWKSQQLYHNSLQGRNKNLELLLSLESPTKNLDYRVGLQYKTTERTVHSHALAQLSEKNRFIARLDYEHANPFHSLELELATPWQRAVVESKLEAPVQLGSSWSQQVNGSVIVKWGNINEPRWVRASAQYTTWESALSAQHAVEGKLEGEGWEQPLLLEGMWTAESTDGVITSNTNGAVTINGKTYGLVIAYIKDLSQEKHDLKLKLELPTNMYTSSLLLINSQELKNITVRLDLEKTLYFTSQLQTWQAFDMQLFWNYLEDKDQSVLVQYKNNIKSEVAVVSMPGHYASLTVDKLGPGFSSMNITAIWGENEGSANNAILLTTYWLLDTTPLYNGLWMPTVQTHVNLRTPFVGFEQQSFELNMNGTTQLGMTDETLVHSVTRVVDVSAKWQDQFVNSNFVQVSNIVKSLTYEEIDAPITFTADVSSSLDIMKKLKIRMDLQDRKSYGVTVRTLAKSCSVEAAYNHWALFAFNSTYTPEHLLVSVDLLNKTADEVILSGELTVVKNAILLKTTLPFNEKIVFRSQYDWPINFSGSLTTPYKGYEESVLKYDINVDEKEVDTSILAKLGEDFLLFAAKFGKLKSVYQGELNVTSTSHLPDLFIDFEHELRKSQQESYIKEFASVTLTKNGKVMQHGRVLISFADESTSLSSRTKRFQSVLELPGHYSSSNYTYQSQIMLKGVQTNHYLIHMWNEDRTEVLLTYEGLSSIIGLLKRNNDKKFEILFENPGNGKSRTLLALPGGYFVKHIIFFTDYTNWMNAFMFSSPDHAVIVKSTQYVNPETTEIVHTTDVTLDDDSAYITMAVKLAQDSCKMENIEFSATTPWTHPVVAKYDLLIDTGATSKHQLQLEYKQDQEIKIELDITATETEYSASFAVHSPFCKQLSGKLHFEVNERNCKADTVLRMNEKHLTTEMELVRHFKNPVFSFNANNSNGNIINIFCAYDISNASNKAKLFVSYFEQKVNAQGHFSAGRNGLKTGFIVETTMVGWEEISMDFDSVLSQKNLMFALNAAINERYLILSGTNNFDRNSLMSSVSLEHTFSAEFQKKSILVDCSTAENSKTVQLIYKNNDFNLVDLNIKYIKGGKTQFGQTSHSFNYKAVLPFESIRNSSISFTLVQDYREQQISAITNINDWQATIKGENTLDFTGKGHLDLKLSASDRKTEFYFKHTNDSKDTYSWHLSDNSDFVSGTISLFKEEESLEVRYIMNSSVTDFKSVEGMIQVRANVRSFYFESLSDVNNRNKYFLRYSVAHGNVSDTMTKHDLALSLPIEGYDDVKGTLEYSRKYTELSYIKGELSDGRTVNKILYHVLDLPWDYEADIDLPYFFKMTFKRTLVEFKTSAKSTSGALPKFSLNFNINMFGNGEFEAESYWTGKIKITARTNVEKRENINFSINAGFNDLHTNYVILLNRTFFMVGLESDIPDWSEFSILLNLAARENSKYSLTISKNREELLYSNVEGFYSKCNGDGLLSVTMQNFFMDLNINYDLSSNFSVGIKYNINGNKQHAEGKMSFLSEYTRIDIATPIKGFEDMTLISTLNRENRQAGLVFQGNGKTINVELSATIESQSIKLKGVVTNGHDKFSLLIGAENRTKDESLSYYIHAFKNKNSVFWLKLEGSYNLQNRPGLSISISSVYYQELQFEILSHNEESRYTFLLSYHYGTEFNYSLKTTLVKAIAKPELVVRLHFGPSISNLEARYDTTSAKKTVAIKFEQDKEKLIQLEGEVYFSMIASKVGFLIENKNLIHGLEFMKILGEYNFTQESFVETAFMVNDVKYFNLLLKSKSLYEVQFLSSLVPSNSINTAYAIALMYTFSIPSSSIFSTVEFNGDYYKCTTNLTWNDSLAETFFHLNTSAGYGFENALLSTKYRVQENKKYSHSIEFVVDDSTLFHVSSKITYPNQMLFDLILPDSLFLPLVKEINVGFNFTEKAKTVLFKYISQSNGKRNLNFSLVLEDHNCDVNLVRSETDSTGTLQSDEFKLSYSIQTDLVVFLSSLSWENNNIFSIMYSWQDPPSTRESDLLLPLILFNIENFHVLNVTVAYSRIFEFAGVLSPSELLFHLKHPSITETRLSLMNYNAVLEEETYFNVYYKNSESTEMGFQYTDIFQKLSNLIYGNGKFVTHTNFTVHIQDKVVSLLQVNECEQMDQTTSIVNTNTMDASLFRIPVCTKLKQRSKLIGLTEEQQSIEFSLDLNKKEIVGTIARTFGDFQFKGKLTTHSKLLCSGVSFNVVADQEPNHPLEFKYETDCENNVYASIKVFEEDIHDFRVNRVNTIDLETNAVTIQGNNFPYLRNWIIKSEKSGHTNTLKIAIWKWWTNIECYRATNNNSLTVESSFNELKKLEITRIFDEMNRRHLGTLKFDGLLSTEWSFVLEHQHDGSILFHSTSHLNTQVNILLNLSNKKELSVKVFNNGKLYQGKGLFQIASNGEKVTGEGYFSLDRELYSLKVEHIVKPEEHKCFVEVKTPNDDYYLETYISKRPLKLDPVFIVRYKTPFHVLDYANIKIWFDHDAAKSTDEFSLVELNQTDRQMEIYNTMYNVLSFTLSVKTKAFDIDKTKLDIYYGDKYGISFSHATKQILFEVYLYENKNSRALQSIFKVSGIDLPTYYYSGKEIDFRAYLNSDNKLIRNAFASLSYHSNITILFVTKQDFIEETGEMIYHQTTSKVLFNKETALKMTSDILVGSHYYVDGEWDDKTVQLHYNVQEQGGNIKMKLVEKNKTSIDSEFNYFKEISADSWVRLFELDIKKLFSIQPLNPKVIIEKATSKPSIAQYNLHFNNGIQADSLFFSGNCSLSFPNLKSFSVDSSPVFHADIMLESVSRQYSAVADMCFQQNKMDTTIKWKRIMKTVTYKQDKEYMVLKFGGFITNKSAELYFNDNKFSGFIDSSSTQSTVSAHLFNDKLKKNITVFASVQYSPIYLLTISHTVFDSPCSVEVKVDRRSQSVESAVTINYNHLTQQAFVNVYLDSNPRYAELMYLDIWQQTHEASVHVEEKANEVTVTGNINSPAIDENFLIVTVSHDNDKFEMNMNDDFIFKVFKGDTSGLLNVVIFGNNYQLQCKYEKEVELSLTTPIGNGVMTFSSEQSRDSFASVLFDTEQYHFLVELNKKNILTIVLSKEEEKIFDTALDIINGSDVFELQFHCNIFGELNGLSVKHVRSPILLVVSLNSSQFIGNNLDIMFGIKNEDLVTGVFEVKQNLTLFKSYIGLSSDNSSVEIIVEAPLFSYMDKLKINGVFNFLDWSNSELKFSAVLYSADIKLSEASVYLIKNNYEIFSSGMVIKRNYHEDMQIALYITIDDLIETIFQGKVHFILKLPSIDFYELKITSNLTSMPKSNDYFELNLFGRREDNVVSVKIKAGDDPFYMNLYEVDVHYLTSKVRLGACMEPKEPLTDYIYYLEWNENRIIEVAHALILQSNHFKSKFVVETAFKGHNKYGIDMELQNLKIGKIVRLVGSVPQLGSDLGIDFGFSYENLLNLAVMAQIRIPYANQVKMVKVYSLHKIHPDLNVGKLNYTFQCSGIGIIGLEVEVHGSVPFIWQGKMSAFESKINLNDNIYLLKAKSLLQSDKIQVVLGAETPFEGFKKGEIYFSGTPEIVGTEFLVELNSNELINVNITEDTDRNKELKVLSNWKNVVFKYKYEVDEEIAINGYLCWDLLNKDTSQFGIVMNTARNNLKYERVIEVLLPSSLIPKLGVKSTFEHSVNRIFSSIQLDLPGLLLEGKLATEISTIMYSSGLQLKWMAGGREPKNIGIFYVKEVNEDEIKYYFTLQHFALPNDVILTTYIRSTLYGINLQYSPIKEEEITLELGYWMIEEGKKEKSGVKIVVVHQASNTLMFGVANVTSTSEITEAGLSVAYLTDQDVNKAKYLAVYGKKNRKTPEIYLGLTSNGNSVGVGGSIWKKDNNLRGITFETKVNQKDPLKAEVVQNLVDPGIEVELSYSLSRTYRVFAGMPNNNELTAKLSHTMYGKPNLDALASLRLNTSRILWGRFELPPMTQVGQEFYSGILEEYSDLKLATQAVSTGFSDFFQEDFSKKIVSLLNGVATQADIIVLQTYNEAEIVGNSIEGMGKIAQRVYNEDHFYLRTFFQHLKSSVSTMYNYLSSAMDVILNITKIVFDPVFEMTKRVWEVVGSVLYQWKYFIREMGVGGESPVRQLSRLVGEYRQFSYSLVGYGRQAIATARTQLTCLEQRSADLLTEAELAINLLIRSACQTMASYLQCAIDYRDTVLAGFSILGDTIQGMIEIVTDNIYRIREVRYSLDWIVRCLDVVTRWFTNFRLETYLRQIDAYLDRIIQLVASDVEKNFGEYEVYLVQAKNLVEGRFEEVSKVPQVLYAKKAVMQIYEKIKWFWSYAKLSERLRDVTKQYFENMKAALDELEKQLDGDDRELRSEYMYNSENNSLTFTQELPFEWRAFNQLPEYKEDVNPKLMSFPAQEYSNMVTTMANYLWQDAKLLPHLLPPFGAEAIISGDSFITFDNSFYNFRGGCGSYLLASDLYHSTFSLLANYDKQNKRDLLLITEDLEILLKNNLEVYVNGKLEDLPLKLNNGKQLILERKVHSVLIKSGEGFSLECSTYQDMCKFHLDGWYIGKTAGLLGTFNHEPSDDFVTPDRQPSDNIRDFIDSWSVEAKQCDAEGDLSTSIEDSRHYEMCEMFFSSQSSPFLPCFHTVDPKSFYDMCLSKASHDSSCSAVMAYLTKCTSSGVQLWMPEFCVDSSISETLMQPEYTDFIEVPAKNSADVVFIIEEADCASSDNLNFAPLLASLNSDLNTKGLIDNKFALVSFNNRDAQIHTVNGGVWSGDEKKINDIVSRLEPSEGSLLYASALQLASDLPYRPGASKIAVLVHCSDCPHSENYGALLERLSRTDISLHILQQAHLAGRKGKGISKVIGLEKSGAYPRKRLFKNPNPDPQLLQQVSAPQDLCTPLVLGTNGTLFELDVTRKGMSTWSGRVADGAAQLSDWQQCENSVGDDNVPMWRCRRSHSHRLKDWDLTALHEYMDTSRGDDIYPDPEYEEEER